MEFQVLGPITVRRDGADGGINGRLARTLLGLLLVRRDELVPVDVLAEAMWPNDPPGGATRRVQLHVSKLRRALGDPSRLAYEADGYRLRVLPGEVDAERFESLLGEGVELAGSDPPRAVELLRKALELWRGEPFGGLDVPALVDEADRLSERRVVASEELFRAELACGRDAALVSELTALVRRHPLRERLSGLLMLALNRSGRQADALRVYRETRHVLVEELGLEPGPELQAIEREILTGAPGDPAGEVRAVEPPAQLPPAVRGFVGRRAELAELDRLGGEESAVVLVAGTAGVGKTALAVHWAHGARERYPDGQLYVDLRGYDPQPPRSPHEVLGGWLRALEAEGHALPLELPERVARVRSLVDGRRLLIVLDNARTAEQVRPLLPGSPSCCVVVTSRDTLTGLVAREGVERIDLDLLPTPESRRLLRATLRESTAVDAGTIDTLVERCARLPLALRIAAERIGARRGLAAADLVRELADRQTRLDLLDVDDDPRAAVRSVFAWSYDALPVETARLFRLHGLHPARADACALAALAGEDLRPVRRSIERLVQANLLHDVGAGRVESHDLLRGYAAELAEHTETTAQREAAIDRLYDYQRTAVAAAMTVLSPNDIAPPPDCPRYDGPLPVFDTRGAATAWLDAERAGLVTLAEHARLTGRPRVTCDLSEQLFRYFDSFGHYDEAFAMHTAARQAARDLGDALAAAHAVRHLSTIHYRWGQHELAHAMAEEAYVVYRDSGAHLYEALQLLNISSALCAIGEFAAARERLRRVIELGPLVPSGDRALHMAAATMLGLVCSYLGLEDEADQHIAAAIVLAREVGNPLHEAMAHGYRGFVLGGRGRDAEARDGYLHLRAFADATGDVVATYNLHRFGTILWRQGRRDEAFAAVERSLDASMRTNDSGGWAAIRNTLGELHRLEGNAAEATTEHRRALELATGNGERFEQARAHAGLGAVGRDNGDESAATTHLRAALSLFTELGLPAAAVVGAQLAASGNPG